jgi:hypothetical protein
MATDDTRLALPQSTEALTPQDLAQLITTLPLWQRLLIARVASGIPLAEARYLEGSKVSPVIIARFRRESPVFDAALGHAEVGAAVWGPDEHRDVARALSVPTVADAFAASRTAQHERDRVANRRLVLETAGAVGGNVQVNVGVQVNNAADQRWQQYQAHVRGKVVEADAKDTKVPQDTEAPKDA